MALTVETGAGLSGAESYASVAAADAYFLARANAAWAALDTPTKEAKLRDATDYMLASYRGRWMGERMTSTQALDWPRYGVVVDCFDVPTNTVPAEVVRACCELALRASAQALQADQGVAVTSETVGPISVSYLAGAQQGIKYPAIDNMLRPFLSAGNGIRVMRA